MPRIPASERRRRDRLAPVVEQLHELTDAGDVGLDEALRIEAAIAAAHAGGDVDSHTRGPAAATVSRTAAAADLRRRR